MTKKQETLLHIGFWLIFFGLNFLSDLIGSKNEALNLWSILQFIGFSIIQMIVFYINYAWICKFTILQKRWLLLFLGQLLLLFVFPVLRDLFEEVLLYKITGNHNYADRYRFTFFYVYDNSFYSVRMVLLSLVFYSLKTIWNTNQQMNELLLQHKQVELQNLKNQLSPHFLFNTLNSFYADLIDTQPKTAEDLLKLSEMLRYVTYENENDRVDLEDEIQFIANYIALFSRRFDHQLAIHFQSSGVEEKVQIPSLLLIHFVENALKHGLATDPKRPINITLRVANQLLSFSVENHYIASEHYDERGIGYKNIRQRLELLYPKNHLLQVAQTQDFYRVNLQIPLL
ncbi:sensor histidine kinase [Pedobacter helvus]|uniref:Sensor histidine kinase n=1 Tax=Pedobacter helvus TaxID=2563444 RepID=A0ABW9JF37_9SPHI|nr:histidine kinase [Pedobacter ureilyticus]